MHYFEGQGEIDTRLRDFLHETRNLPFVQDCDLNNSGFRSRLFYEASSGSSRILPEGRLKVNLHKIREMGFITDFCPSGQAYRRAG